MILLINTLNIISKGCDTTAKISLNKYVPNYFFQFSVKLTCLSDSSYHKLLSSRSIFMLEHIGTKTDLGTNIFVTSESRFF